MDFYIKGVISQPLDTDPVNLNLFKAGDFGKDLGIQYITGVVSYKQHVLALSTQLNLIAPTSNGIRKLGELKSATVFEFLNQALLVRGATKKAKKTLQDCYDLAQAHGYGALCYYAEQIELPMIPTGLVPREVQEKTILSFLMKNNKMGKN